MEVDRVLGIVMGDRFLNIGIAEILFRLRLPPEHTFRCDTLIEFVTGLPLAKSDEENIIPWALRYFYNSV